MRQSQRRNEKLMDEVEKISREKVCSICGEPLGDGDVNDPLCTYCAAKLRAVFNDE